MYPGGGRGPAKQELPDPGLGRGTGKIMILNRAERMLTRRYLLPGKGEGFIFLVASISLIAVALGVAALIIVMSVMNGFRAELFDKIVGLNGHAVVQGYNGRLPDWQRIADAAKKQPGVTSALPLIETPLMATANGRFEGVLVRGMRVEDILANKTITSNVLAGDIKSIVPGSNRVAIGSRLADTLGAYPGSQITLWNPEGRSTVVGTVPREVTYTVGAIFEIGVYDYDKAFVILPMQDAQQLLLMGDQVGMIEIQTSNPDKVQEILAPLRKLVQGKGVITDWRQMNSALFQALEVERVAMFVVLSLIVLVAVFNILSSLIMLVRAKTRDIAILRTMGASRRGMMKVFMTVGVTIGSLGIVLGMILGAIFLYFRQDVVDAIQAITGQNLWDPSVRFLTELPSKTDPFEVAAIVLTALILSFLATLYPAYKAASTDPVQVLRYE
jgi:lipoprotein-releasing system permease protein